MKRFAFVLCAGAALMLARAASAQSTTLGVAGAPLDHLVCYRTLDDTKITAATDLIAELQPEFTQKGCKLLRPVEFCVPATKINVSPVPPNPNITGTPLKNDYICYLAKCKNPIPPPDKLVIDQFGARRHQNYRLSKVCVPAQKAPARCGFAGRQCSGACPLPTQLCKLQRVNGVRTCDCVTETDLCGGRPDSAGHCGGACPNPADVCLPTLVGTGDPTTTKLPLECRCRPRTDPICSRDVATGACGGGCPLATQKCMTDVATGLCQCIDDPPPPCQVTGTTATGPTCGGSCPAADQNCAFDPITGQCGCQPQGCSQDANGTCGGPCPSGMSCLLDSTGVCSCKDTPCGSTGTAGVACGGACPLASQTCAQDATGACNCLPVLPCQTDGNGTCGGTCPAPQICRNIAGTPDCRCQ